MTEQDILNKFGVKKLDHAAFDFMANGKKYYKINTLVVGRTFQYDMWYAELVSGLEIEKLHNTFEEVYSLLNARKDADAAVRLKKAMEGIELTLVRHNAALKICCLFMCIDGEDAKAELTEEQIAEKIDDWVAEGYTYEDFFSHAVTFVNGLRKRLMT